MIGAKPLRIWFDKVNGFIRIYDESRYLVSFRLDKYDAIFNMIRYLIGIKSSITYAISHYYAKVKVNS